MAVVESQRDATQDRGYPAGWLRFRRLYSLDGDGSQSALLLVPAGGLGSFGKLIARDLDRIESDQLDDHHVRRYAAIAGCTTTQAGLVLGAFFSGAADR